MTDFEDALIAYTAKRREVDFIVTCDKTDFAHSPVPAMTPVEFVGLSRPACLEYEMVDLWRFGLSGVVRIGVCNL